MAGDKSRFNGKKGGRPKGKKSQSTLIKEKVEAAVRQRIFGMADSLITAQTSIAKGQQFLYKIVTVHYKGKDGKMHEVRKEPKQVKAQWEIEDYLHEKLGNKEKDPDIFYFITTKEPDNRALDSLMNRGFGKPTESIEFNDKTVPVSDKKKEEFNKAITFIRNKKK